MKLRPTLLEMVDEIPPQLCVMIARRARKPIPEEEIKRASGLSRRGWQRLMKSNSFREFIAPVDAFLAACGINPVNYHRHRAYVIRTYSKAKRPLRHLRRVK